MIAVGIAVVSVTCSAVFYMRWKRLTRRLSVAEQLLQTIEHTSDFFFYCELVPEAKYTYLSNGFRTFFGEQGVEQHILTPLETYLHYVHLEDIPTVMRKVDGTADYSKPFLLRFRTQQGTYRWFEEYATPTFQDGKLIAINGIYRDVHERIVLQKGLEHKVMHDSLTNVKNRTFFEEQLILLNGMKEQSCGIIICDLDNLKTINDTKGHKAGDMYIQQSAKLLMRVIGECGHVCRIGGDEFAIVCQQLTREQLQQKIDEIERAIIQYNDDSSKHLCMSIGYSYTTSAYESMDRVFKEADAAMYDQKLMHKCQLH